MLKDGLLIGLVIDTNLPTTWHFADNLCGFCTGRMGILTTDLWLRRYFEEMRIDPKAQPEEMSNSFGRTVMHYPNPFVRHIAYAQTRNFATPCAPWKSSRYAVGQPAHTSVIIFFKNKLHDILYGVVQARAKAFCRAYTNESIDAYHEVTGIYYIELDVPNIQDDWEGSMPCPMCGHYKCACGRKKVEKVKVEVEEIGNSL